MKPVRQISMRFGVSLAAYAVFFLKPCYLPDDAWQDFTDTSLCVLASVFLIPVLLRGPTISARIAALLVILPPLFYLAMFLYVAVPELIRYGHRIYADA